MGEGGGARGEDVAEVGVFVGYEGGLWEGGVN